MEIKDVFDDTPIPEKIEAICSASDLRGNYVIIRHSKHEYSMIAHIKKGSFCVKAGDKVCRGQQIACCGNSGNTSEPHIHFQIQQGKRFCYQQVYRFCLIKLKTIRQMNEHMSDSAI